MLETNEYFDGKIKSIGFKTATLPATLGVMEIGEFELDTSKKEVMTVVSGALTVKLPNSDKWETYNQGDSFIVPANEKFQLKVEVASAYLCTYE